MSLHTKVLTDLSLTNRTALVTGGGGGIGSAIVRLFLDVGAEVFSIDRPCIEAPAGSVALPCDLTDPTAIHAVVRDHCPAPDVIVHCAGITRDAVLWNMQPEDWQLVMRVNLDAAFHLLQAAVPGMRERGTGAITLISSINGERGKFGQANYAASKAGLLGLMKTAALELGRSGIRVNAITPGLIDTPMTQQLPAEIVATSIEQSALRRMGQPEDVARAALFLSTDLSSHITGQSLRVDGGALMA